MPGIFLLYFFFFWGGGGVILLLDSALRSEFSCYVNIAIFLFNIDFVVSILVC